MKKTILTCDRCKKEVAALLEVGAGLRSYSYGPYGPTATWKVSGQLHQEWCRPCCEEVGFITSSYGKKEDKKEEVQPPTMEDLIREMIRSEMEGKS